MCFAPRQWSRLPGSMPLRSARAVVGGPTPRFSTPWMWAPGRSGVPYRVKAVTKYIVIELYYVAVGSRDGSIRCSLGQNHVETIKVATVSKVPEGVRVP